jgi:hypothetical protein
MYIKILVGKPEGKRLLGRTRRRRKSNIRLDLAERGWDKGSSSSSSSGLYTAKCCKLQIFHVHAAVLVNSGRDFNQSV